MWVKSSSSKERHGGSIGAPSEPMDRSPEQYRRESPRKTMLKHEEVFKQQVNELHRLYGVQKMLMDYLRNNELSVSTSTSGTSQSSYPRKGYHSPMRLNTEISSQQQCNPQKFREKTSVQDKDLYADGDGEIKLNLTMDGNI